MVCVCRFERSDYFGQVLDFVKLWCEVIFFLVQRSDDRELVALARGGVQGARLGRKGVILFLLGGGTGVVFVLDL